MIYLMVVLVALVGLLAYQQFAFSRMLQRARDEAHVERGELLQRIQAPEVAVAMHAEKELDVELVRHHVDFDDDEDFANYRSTLEG